MDLKHLLLHYGPLVILVWTFFEGETVLLVAGFLAHKHYMPLGWCISAAFVGSMAGDQLYFWIGRRFGPQILEWRPGWRPLADRALGLLVRYQNLFILSFRFIYMVRNVASFSIGFAGVSFRRFTILNAIAALVWALSFGFGGYFFGKTMQAALGGLERFEGVVGGAIAVILLVLWWRRRAQRRRTLRAEAAALPEASRPE